jgi:hypothetical protein
MSEMIDDDGYPTEEMLDKIEKWEYNFNELMRFIKPYWRYSFDGYWSENECEGGKTEYNISTAGWSGSEDIVRAMSNNTIFWSLCWVQSRRGGHYIFEVKE